MATQILGKVAYTSRGAYDSSFSYEINDVVTYNGSSYVSKKETKGNLPTNEEYWMLLAEKGSTYQVTEEDLNNIANEITTDANSAFNQNVTSKTNAFDANASSQTSAFNENAGKKITAFDNNANAKTTSYNNNATSALSAYDTNHNEKVEAYNTNANAKLKEFNENASSYDERITDNTNRTKRIENTLYDSGEANGASINIKDSTLAEFQEIVVDGVCKQVTTTGKNTLNYTNVANRQGIVSTLTQDGSIRSTGTLTEDYFNITTITYDKSIQLGKNTFSIDEVKDMRVSLNFQREDETSFRYDINIGTKFVTFNLNEEYVSYYLSCYKQGSKGQTINMTTKFQVEAGDKATELEPYTGGQASPSPSYSQPIEVIDEGFDVVSCSEGVFDGELIQGTFNGVGNSTRCFNKNNILLEKGEYVFITDLDIEKYKYGILLSENAFPTETTNWLLDSGWLKTKMYTLNVETEGYFGLNIASTSDTDLIIPSMFANNKFILVNVNSLTRTPINLPDGEFVGKINENAKDQVRIAFNEEKGEYHAILEKNIGKVVLDGSTDEAWVITTNAPLQINSTYFSSPLLDKKIKSETAISNYFSLNTPNNIWNYDIIGFCIDIRNNKSIRIRINKEIANDITEFIQWLSQNNLIIYYELAEPYEVDLGVVDMPLSYSPETNVFTTSELEALINAKYYRNFINTIQNLQVNEKALQQELIDINSRLSALETNLVNLANEEVESESEE